MASDNHASYAKIGFTVFIGVVAIVATLIYLGGLRGRGGVFLAETYYDKPVTGLSVGSVVNFRGVKIGEVQEISLLGNKYEVDDKDMSRVYILMALDSQMISPGIKIDAKSYAETLRRLVVQRGLRATVKVNAVTGLARMEIDFIQGEDAKSMPMISWRPHHTFIPPTDSLIDSFSVAATKVMNQINRMDLNTFWSNLNASVESVSQCAETANVMMSSRQADVERIMDNLTTTSESLRALAAELRQNPSVLVRGAERQVLEETAR